ncbi:hypothetical protein BAU15_13215 [Enterococcus sp. JM4C]|uniref:DUF1189 family protein n=1 Tax=Candidatus Enterococcus huntleyi TaxID=1857217 RepID=UPI00137B8A49|nr:DUF1189 family protein [Enterococcus sp. JM4C]KAF1297719.1 hypothetical protein BAU15_13215 [Enterococcus sp. JM4C]
MKTDVFPTNYFRAIFSPKKVFQFRKKFNWLQLFVLYLFLTALLVIPATLYFAQTTTINEDQFMPHVKELLTAQTAQEVQQLSIKDGRLVDADPQIFEETDQGVAGVNLSEKQVNEKDVSLNFKEKNWQIKENIDGKSYTYQMNYSAQFSPEKISNQQELRTAINEEFVRNNRSSLILTMSVTTGFLLFMMNLLLVLGAAFFLWLTKKSRLSSIQSYSESLAMVLMSMGIGSLVALVIGLFHFDITLLIGIQSFGMIGMLFASYLKTRFKEDAAIAMKE